MINKNDKREGVSWLVNFLLSGIGLYIFDRYVGSRIDWTVIDVLSFLSYPLNITVLDIIVFLVFFFSGFMIIKMNFLVKESYYTRDQRKIREMNCEYNEELGVLFKWNVLFDYNDKPFIAEFWPYCLKHGNPPMKMIKKINHYTNKCFECSVPGCETEINLISYQFIKNKIETELMQEYNKIKNKKRKR